MDYRKLFNMQLKMRLSAEKKLYLHFAKIYILEICKMHTIKNICKTLFMISIKFWKFQNLMSKDQILKALKLSKFYTKIC